MTGYSNSHLDVPLYPGWAGHVVMSFIPVGVIFPLLNRGPIHLAFLSLVQLATILGGVSLIDLWLRRFTASLCIFGLTLAYAGFCYGTNALYIWSVLRLYAHH